MYKIIKVAAGVAVVAAGVAVVSATVTMVKAVNFLKECEWED